MRSKLIGLMSSVLCAALCCVGCSCGIASVGSCDTINAPIAESGNMTETEREFERMLTDKKDFPVSFVYGGVFYDGFGGFRDKGRTDKTEGEKHSIEIKYVHPDGKLEVTVDAAVYPKYDAYEWTVYFKNIGESNSAVLSDLWDADFVFEGNDPVLKWNDGDYGGHFTPHVTDLSKERAVFAADTGRSAEQYMPYFNLETDNGGLMMAVGWPGTWRTEFESKSGVTRVLGTGTANLAAYLKPGETVRTALMAFVRYYTRDEDVAANKWRRWFIDCNMPYETAEKKNKVPAYTVLFPSSDTEKGWYRGGSEYEDHTTWQKTVNVLKSHDMQFDIHHFDAGWYVNADNASTKNTWWDVGTWTLDSTKWPRDTLKTYNKAVQTELGVKYTNMWFEVDRMHGSIAALQKNFGADPVWYLPAPGENYLVNQGIAECSDWLFRRITNTMEHCGIDIYREDHNFQTVPAFKAGDAFEGAFRRGITENKYYQGKLALWDRILEWQASTGRPTFIEMQAAGGNRLDLELFRRSISFFRSDSDIRLDPPFTVSKVNALNKWIPYGGVLFGELPYTDSTNDRNMYMWRSCYASQMTVALQFQKMNAQTWELVKNGLAEYDRYKQFVFADFYELTPWKPLFDRQQWVSRMYFDPDSDSGVMETFCPSDAKANIQKIKLKGVDADKYYTLSDPDGLNGIQRIKGSELISGINITLQPESASLLWITPAE